MKKSFLQTILLCIIIVMSAKQVKAFGTFQLLNFKSSTTVISGYPFSWSADYFYSGTYLPQISLVGTNIPQTEHTSNIRKGNALYNFSFDGKMSGLGEYPLTLTLTDNDGAFLAQPISFKVIQPSFTVLTESLPNGVIYEPYSATIKINYIGSVSVSFINLPPGLDYRTDDSGNTASPEAGGTLTVSISGKPMVKMLNWKPEMLIKLKTTFRADSSDRRTADYSETTKIYSLILTEKNTPVSLNNSQPTQQTVSEDTSSNTNNNSVVITENKTTTVDTKLQNKLKGYILLQVESKGEAWYVNPADGKRYYMKDGAVAYQMMRNFGLGIKNSDLAKIPEEKQKNNYSSFVNKQKGKILLQVENHGEAWYVNPKSGYRYYMKDGNAAYNLMRYQSIGITNKDLEKIPEGAL